MYKTPSVLGRNDQVHILSLSLAAALVASTGCGDDSNTLEVICGDPYGRGCGDTGGEDVPDPVEESCVTFAADRPLSVYQCNGSLTASLSFKTLLGNCTKTLGDAAWCSETHDFGVGLDTQQGVPAVMACCDPDQATEETILDYCAADMVEQICRSVPLRLQAIVDRGLIDVGKGQANSLIRWFNEHQQSCFNNLHERSAVAGTLQGASWRVPNNLKWSLLKDFTITIDDASIISYTLPLVDADRQTCYDDDLNNGEIFEYAGPWTPGISDVCHLADRSGVSVFGPVVGEPRAQGSAELGLDSRDCDGARCPRLSITDIGTSDKVLDEFELFAEGDVVVRRGEMEVPVSGASIRLYGTAQLRYQEVVGYVVAPGEAHFVISGTTGPDRSDVQFRWATNTTPIVFLKSAGIWGARRFTVAHATASGEVWTLDIESSYWN